VCGFHLEAAGELMIEIDRRFLDRGSVGHLMWICFGCGDVYDNGDHLIVKRDVPNAKSLYRWSNVLLQNLFEPNRGIDLSINATINPRWRVILFTHPVDDLSSIPLAKAATSRAISSFFASSPLSIAGEPCIPTKCFP
jgi:hypothetical protein